MTTTKQWYEAWFNSPYYRILYKNRNEKEAIAFIDHLIAYLKPPKNARMLDLACGNGRHAKRLASYGFDVTGIDIAENLIRDAKYFETDNLTFYKHDMRQLFRTNYFDYIFNIFTSFGYFERESDNDHVINAVHKGLKPKGRFIIDYFNSYKVINTMTPIENKVIDGIEFNIRKFIKNKHIIKKIRFSDNNEVFSFEERVSLLTLVDFEHYFMKYNMNIVDVFGDYSLNEFDYSTSDRLIIIAEKV